MNTEITVGSRVSFAGTEWVVGGVAEDRARIEIGNSEYAWVRASRLTLVEPEFVVEEISSGGVPWRIFQKGPSGTMVAGFSTESEAIAYCAAANRAGLPFKIGGSA